MKVLLVYPYFLEKRIHEEDISALPIGLYYVGALLKSHGYEVEILNWHAANRNPGVSE
jgi:anaerobic magnesium-protoporphyrin IX monomethyl ester cyclase